MFVSDSNSEWLSFIIGEREKYEIEDNNRFAFAAGQAVRYLEFLDIIKREHGNTNKVFADLINEIQQKYGNYSGLIPTELGHLLQEQYRVSIRLQLEIESYYLFAKILLDKISRFIEFYFGQSRGLSLDSHDQWTKNCVDFCKEKQLTINDDIQPQLQKLKTDIADYRDYQIAHDKNLRTAHGVSFIDGKVEISKGLLYPKDTDKHVKSGNIQTIDNDINNYLLMIIKFLERNRRKSRLKIHNE